MIPLIILAIESPQDREYMTSLYLEYERLMYWEINKYIRNPWDADDVLQSVLERLIDKLDELKGKESRRRSAYILATCRNTSINYLKRKNRISEHELALQDFDGIDVERNETEEFVVRKSEYALLYAAWKMLDPQSVYLLEARYVLEKSTKEIAEDLGIQSNSARVYISRARTKLRKEYESIANRSASRQSSAYHVL